MFTRITPLEIRNAYVLAGGTKEDGVHLNDLIVELQFTGYPLVEVLVAITQYLSDDRFVDSVGNIITIGTDHER